MFYSQNRILCGASREITDRRKVGDYVRKCMLETSRLIGLLRGQLHRSPSWYGHESPPYSVSRMEAAEQGDR